MIHKRSIAFYQAAHAIASFHSRFFIPVWVTDITNQGEGDCRDEVSRSKVQRFQQKHPRPIDLEIAMAKDKAVVLCAGLVGQEIALEKRFIVEVDPDGSQQDLEYANEILDVVGQAEYIDHARELARQRIRREWWAVETVAMFLFSEGAASAEVLLEMIHHLYWDGRLA